MERLRQHHDPWEDRRGGQETSLGVGAGSRDQIVRDEEIDSRV
eukprot:CAMPEP_0174894624 /NCGR_PEP_ID=MMETSP0167-20121228/9220_1 /TAXON_ID=38298 /ORGANISM="Rhodella maculata, Strain CCMP736" /LENGTH=42 /DNA_ID= /DNA_START= /DNA_END= /DNA_ORIENTATION=